MTKRTSREATRGKTADSSEVVAALQRRYQELERRRIEAGRDLKHAQDRLETLETEARETYGTDDLERLREKLDGMRRENAKRLEDYRTHLATLEQGLAEIESRYARQESDGQQRGLTSGAAGSGDEA